MNWTEGSLAVAYRNGTATLMAAGCLRGSHADALRKALRDVISLRPGRLVLDLTQLRELDTALIRAIAELQRSPAGHLVPIVVRSAPGPVRELLMAHELGDLLVDRAEDAAEEGHRPSRRMAP